LCNLAVQGRKEIDLIPRKAAGQKGLTHSSAQAQDADEKGYSQSLRLSKVYSKVLLCDKTMKIDEIWRHSQLPNP